MKKYLEELNKFTIFLENSGYKSPTVKSYFYNLKDFFQFLKRREIELYKFNSQTVNEYLNSLKSKNSAQTINSKIYAITKFIEYIKNQQNIDIALNLIHIKTKNKKELKPIKNIGTIINEIDLKEKNLFIKNRDKLLINLIYFTGLRTKDILKLTVNDIDDNIIRVNSNIIFLNNELIKQIKDFASLIKLNGDNFLFTNFTPAQKSNKSKNSLTEKSVQDIFNKYKGVIDNNLSIRDLRSSYVTNLDEHFLALKIIKIYGYSDVETELDYLSYIKNS